MSTLQNRLASRLLSDANHDIEAVGQITTALDQAVWDLTSAVSMYDKAKAGYRSSRKTGDAPWDAASLLEDVQAAQSALDAAVVNALSALAKA